MGKIAAANVLAVMRGRVPMQIGPYHIEMDLNDTVLLTGYGRVPAVTTDQLLVGNITVWDFGVLYEIVEVRNISPKYVVIVKRGLLNRQKMTRRFTKARKVGLSIAYPKENPQLDEFLRVGVPA